MFTPEDGVPTYSCAPLPTEQKPVIQSGTEEELNPIIVLPQETYYAFFDKFEEVPETTLCEGFSRADLGAFKPAIESKQEATAYEDGLGQEAECGWIYARFDGIAVDYFNNNIGELRTFYQNVRQENIDQEHVLDKDFHHGSDQAGKHLQLVQRFLKPMEPFCSIYLAFANSPENRKKFLDIFGEDGRWIGLQLGAAGVPVDLYTRQEENECSSPERKDATLLAVYELTPKRINNLQHVVSLDFAPDAHLGGTPVTETPVPQTPLLPTVLKARSNSKSKSKKNPPTFTVYQDRLPPVTSTSQKKVIQTRKALAPVPENVASNRKILPPENG